MELTTENLALLRDKTLTFIKDVNGSIRRNMHFTAFAIVRTDPPCRVETVVLKAGMRLPGKFFSPRALDAIFIQNDEHRFRKSLGHHVMTTICEEYKLGTSYAVNHVIMPIYDDPKLDEYVTDRFV